MFAGMPVACDDASRLRRTFARALSSSAMLLLGGRLAAGAAESITIDCRVLLAPHGAQPALASTSSEFGDSGAWYLPEKRLARFRRCEKKLSR